MKTTKLFLSLALVALTVTSFGRISDFSNTEFENDLVMESWMASPFNTMERDLIMESWMVSPFEAMESDVVVESWMTAPFASDAQAIECWMSTPFKVGNEKYCADMMAATK